MGKGLSQRHRIKQAKKANEGNLRKAQLGKGGATPYLPLPQAPKSEEFIDRVPRSLQKLMALKAAAENGFKRPVPQAKVPKSTNKFRVPGAGASFPVGAPGSSEAITKEVEGGEAGAAGVASEQPQQQPHQQPEQPHSKKPGSGAAGSGADTRGLPMNPFEITKAKTLKQSKKDYLNRKKLKKKGKGAKPEGTLLECCLRDRGKVGFGETSDRPLEVNLKRKHFVNQERTASDRCREIFMKQIGEAQRRDTTLRGGVPADCSGGPSGGAHQQGGHKRSSPSEDGDAEALRLQVIAAYRAQKKGAGPGGATMQTMKALVGKSVAAAAAALALD